MNDRDVNFGPYEVAEYFQAACLAALEACNSDPITTTYVGVGLSAYDDVCGTLIATPSNIYRSQVFPVEDTALDHCAAATIAVQIDIAVLRCIPTITDTGKVPSAASVSAAHKRILDDQAIVWSAMNQPVPDGYEWETALHRQTPINSQAGAAGFLDSIVVGIESSRWCVDCG